MKLMLIVWLAIQGLPPDSVSGYEFKSQEDCEANVKILLKDNANVGAACITVAEWESLNHN